MENILLTGATGFLGNALLRKLNTLARHNVTAAVRRPPRLSSLRIVNVPGLSKNTDWSASLTNQHVVIHAAARAHVIKEELGDPLGGYHQVNVDGTLNLARQAASADVKRFIFISSIGVNGGIGSRPFTEDDAPNPMELYAKSKWEAEKGLWEIQRETSMEFVIIRPPLVYGPNAPGSFGSLMRWIEKGVPLPLGAIQNQRSLVALDNLVSLIIACIDHPAAANQVFLAGDGQDLSTTELCRGVARALGRPSRLFPVPSSFLMMVATLLGKKVIAQRLLGSLQVDVSKARDLLGWEPPISVEEGLRRCCIED